MISFLWCSACNLTCFQCERSGRFETDLEQLSFWNQFWFQISLLSSNWLPYHKYCPTMILIPETDSSKKMPKIFFYIWWFFNKMTTFCHKKPFSSNNDLSLFSISKQLFWSLKCLFTAICFRSTKKSFFIRIKK